MNNVVAKTGSVLKTKDWAGATTGKVMVVGVSGFKNTSGAAGRLSNVNRKSPGVPLTTIKCGPVACSRKMICAAVPGGTEKALSLVANICCGGPTSARFGSLP